MPLRQFNARARRRIELVSLRKLESIGGQKRHFTSSVAVLNRDILTVNFHFGGSVHEPLERGRLTRFQLVEDDDYSRLDGQNTSGEFVQTIGVGISGVSYYIVESL